MESYHKLVPEKQWLWLLVIWVTGMDKLTVMAETDPCEFGEYTVIDDYRREVSYSTPERGSYLCDIYLRSGWYRFYVNGSDATLPTTCVEPNSCGTQAPVWLQLPDGGSPEAGEEEVAKGCSSWSTSGRETNCCFFPLRVVIRNCGGFFIYRLSSTQACNIAFCVERQVIECDEGQLYDTVLKQCVDIVFPSLTMPICQQGEQYSEALGHCIPLTTRLEQPFITTFVDETGDAYVNCSWRPLSPAATDNFIVTWYNADVIGRLQPIHLGQALRLGSEIFAGTTVACGVKPSAYLRDQTKEEEVVSEPYFLGLRVRESNKTVREDGRAINITIYSTIPFYCQLATPVNDCVIGVTLMAFGAGEELTNRLRFSSCYVEFSAADCIGGVCSEHVVQVTLHPNIEYASSKHKEVVSLIGAIDDFGRSFWRQEIVEVQLELEELPFAHCHFFTDSHIITFDGKTYDLHRRGTYVLHKSLSRDFLIHIRVSHCGNDEGSCACGFVARDAGDLVSIDLCSDQRPPGQTVVTFPGNVISDDVKVYESKGGRLFTVVFASGTLIKTYLEPWGMSISLVIPATDLGFSRGLCGLYDGNEDNDFHDMQGSTGTVLVDNSTLAVMEFVHIWRLEAGSSLFDQSSALDPLDLNVPSRCDCSSIIRNSTCHLTSLVDDITPSVAISRDKTDFFFSQNSFPWFGDRAFNVMVLDDLNAHNDSVPAFREIEHAEIVPTRNANPISAKSETAGTPDLDFVAQRNGSTWYFFQPDYLQSYVISSARPPSASGLNESEAYDICTEKLFGSSVGYECIQYLGGFLDSALQLCIADLQVKGDKSWADYTLSLLASLCDISLLQSARDFRHSGRPTPDWPKVMVDAIVCPDGCKNGICGLEECVCFMGFRGSGCQEAVDAEILNGTSAETSALPFIVSPTAMIVSSVYPDTSTVKTSTSPVFLTKILTMNPTPAAIHTSVDAVINTHGTIAASTATENITTQENYKTAQTSRMTAASMTPATEISTTPAAVTSVTTKTAEVNSGTTMKAEDNSDTTMTAEVNSGTTMKAEVNSDTTMTAEDNSDTTMKAEDNSGTTMTAEVNFGTTMTAEDNSGTTMTAEVNSGTTMTAEDNPGTIMTAEVNSGTTMTAEVNSGTTMTAEVNSDITMTAEVNFGTTMTAEDNSGTTMTAEVNSDTTMTAEDNPGTIMTSEVNSGTTMTAEDNPGTTMTAEDNPGTIMTAEVNSGTNMTAEVNSGITMTAEVNSGTTMTAKDNSGTTMKAEDNSDTTMMTEVTSDSTMITKVTSSSTMTTDVTSNTTMTVDFISDTTMTAEVIFGPTVTAEVSSDTTMMTKVTSSSTMTADISSNTTMTVDVISDTTMTAKVTFGPTVTAEVSSDTTMTTEVTSGTTMTTEVTSGTTLTTEVTSGATMTAEFISSTTVTTAIASDTTMTTATMTSFKEETEMMRNGQSTALFGYLLLSSTDEQSQTRPVELHPLHPTFQLCDVSQESCTDVRFDATSDERRLRCRVTVVEVRQGQVIPVPFSSAIFTGSTYTADGAFVCVLPRLDVLRQIFSSRHPSDSVKVEVISDTRGSLGMEATVVSTVIFTIYDSQCRRCGLDGRFGCSTKPDTCYIDGRCVTKQQQQPFDTCLQCRPEIDREQWSTRADNIAPVISFDERPVVFVGQDVSLWIRANDPDGSRLILSVNRKDAFIGQSGLFQWRAAADKKVHRGEIGTELFLLTARDECNATTTFELLIQTVPCECQNDGTCMNPVVLGQLYHYQCLCSSGFLASTATLTTSISQQCYMDNCQYRGSNQQYIVRTTCTITKRSLCKARTTERPRCEVEVNECADSQCVHGACIDLINDFECLCDPGFTGVLCDVILDQCLDEPCFPGVLCQPVEGSFLCGPCPAEFTGDGTTCVAIDSCQGNPCFPGVACVNVASGETGAFDCAPCPRFFEGDGRHCTRSAELACDKRLCSWRATCEELNEFPGYRCGPCPTGFNGTGITCEPICKGKCPPGQVCIRPDECECPAGYTGDQCNTAVCRPSCDSGGECVAPNVCRCFPGYTGYHCQQTSCKPDCANGGRCIGSNRCLCRRGFTGARCHMQACQFPCRNGGQCIGHNRCLCKSGYQGEFCEQASCYPPCLNGGTCVNPGTCACEAGYHGTRCERALCLPACQNGGVCKRFNLCKCQPGYVSYRCQTAVCRPACINGGRCVAPNTCSCASGWLGHRCDQPYCHLPCQNAGLCFKPDICVCRRGYGGADCTTPSCWPVCANDGWCVAPNICHCRSGFYGPRCWMQLEKRQDVE